MEVTQQQPPGAGDEKEVRLQIVDAAFAVLQEVGPTRLRVQEVARRAGVSPTLLYYYFDGKHALIAAAYARDYSAILLQDLALMRSAFDEAHDPVGLLEVVTTSYSRAFMDADVRRRRLDALSAAQHDPVVAAAIAPQQRMFIEELRKLVNGLIAKGWLPETIDVNAFVMSMLAMPFGLVFQDLDPSFEVDMGKYLVAILPTAPRA